jgi:hypothetical protein
MGLVLAFPSGTTAPGFERAVAAFFTTYTAGRGAWAAGTAKK